MNVRKLFRLRGSLPDSTVLTIQALGAVVGILLWELVARTHLVSNGILPSPVKVFSSYGDLLREGLVWHTFTSLKLNLLGYVEAVAICIPLGFILGLYPLFDALSERLLASTRFLPLPAAMGIFIAAFGISSPMKIHFLAVGIIVYLLPTVVGRVRETPDVYVQTIRTLGATNWQVVWRVFVPDVLSRVFVDIGVLVAISWTYITIAESLNSSEGGLGALAYIAERQSRVDKIYAILVLIMTIGWTQDWILKKLNKVFFPWKNA
jgi:NitT/TauT family transport system permease protein